MLWIGRSFLGTGIACPVCRGATRHFSEVEKRQLLICKKCRHVAWAAMPTNEYLQDYYAKTYTTHADQKNVQAANIEYYKDHSLELARLCGKSPQQLSIADIGCSYPVFLEQGKKIGFRAVTGVDWSAEAQAYGKSVGVPVIGPDAFLTDTPDGSLDIMRYSHTLEHLVDPLGALSAQISKLRRGGLLYITQPNFPVFRAQKAGIELKDNGWPNHLHFFNPLSVLRLVEKAGARILKFFSVTDEMETEQRYRPAMDILYAARNLMKYAAIGEPERGPLNGYPFFTGENSAVYAVKK